MKVSESTRICSVHFRHGGTVPYVKSPSLIKHPQPSRRVLIREPVKDRYQLSKPVPSLLELAKKRIELMFARSIQLEQTVMSMKEKLSLQESACGALQTELQQTLQTVSTLSEKVVTLQAEKSHLLSQLEASAARINSLQTEISKLRSENGSLQRTVLVYEENRYRLRAEYFNGRDKDIQFYTGFATWDLFLLFFQSLEVYDVNNLQYVGRERTFPDGKKQGPPRALDPLNRDL